jgi:membrane dipeptidase
MIRTTLFFFALAGLFFGCRSAKPAQDEHLRRALALLETTPIVDTHIDFPWHVVEHGKFGQPGSTSLAVSNPEGQFDWERAKKGGVYGPFMSIYIPAKYQNEPGRSRQLADSLIDFVHAIARDYPDKFALVARADEVLSNFKKGIISLPMGIENGSPIEKIEDVAYFLQRGVRYVTLAHSRDNHICDSSYDTLHTHQGLSEFGRAVVREMNRLGMMVDVSHLSDQAIVDILAVATKPLIATHSACRHFTPTFERNLPDSLIVAIARTGGVVQVPFSQSFLGEELRLKWRAARKERDERKIPEIGPEAVAFFEEYGRKHGEPFWISVSEVADHIDHIKKLAGIDHVGLGSDFDGVGYTMPKDLNDVGKVPNLLAELFRRGYTEEEVRKICSGNVFRVWRANEAE